MNLSKFTVLAFVFLFPENGSATGKHSVSNLTKDEIPIGQTILCKESLSIGFHWEKGGWIKANYKPDNVVFKKVDHRNIKSGKICYLLLSEKSVANKDYVSDVGWTNLQRCYSVGEMGKGDPTIKSCTETYRDTKLVKVSCEKGEYTFHPTQLYLKGTSSVSRDVLAEPKDDYKDSYSIAHGSCTKL